MQRDSKISFQEQFVTCFKNISIYNTTNINELNNSLIKVLLPKKHLLENQFKLFDLNNTGVISFVILKKIINITQIELTNDVQEYLVYVMKNDTNNNLGLKQLNYYLLLHLLESNQIINTPDDAVVGGKNEPIIEITNEEYLQKAKEVLLKINSYMNTNNTTLNDLFGCAVDNMNDKSKPTIELGKLLDILKNECKIELNSMEIFCLFSKVKMDYVSNDDIHKEEIIDYTKLKEEINNINFPLEINNNNNNKMNDSYDYEGDFIDS